HGLVERESGPEHDSEKIDRIWQRILQLLAVAFDQVVKDLLRQKPAQKHRGNHDAEFGREGLIAFHIQRSSEQGSEECKVKERIERERFAATNARMGKLVLNIVEPAVRAGNHRDVIKDVVQEAASASARDVSACEGMGLQVVKTGGEGIVL